MDPEVKISIFFWSSLFLHDGKYKALSRSFSTFCVFTLKVSLVHVPVRLTYLAVRFVGQTFSSLR